jgi:oligopeptide transport system ATP-binding protein
MPPLLEVRELSKSFAIGHAAFPGRRLTVHAVASVDLDVRQGETLGLVGESGSGKSTLARCIARLDVPSGGQVRFQGREIHAVSGRSLRQVHREIQMVFQNPYASLNPRRSAGRIISEPLAANGIGDRRSRRSTALEMLEKLGLRAADFDRLPHEFSGGQRQRIVIARALVLGPKLVVADEPVSALDVSIQAQILNLLRDLQDELGLGYLFISHDLRVVRQISDRVAVMYMGRFCEEGPTEELCAAPLHPYTEALIAAVPDPSPRRTAAAESATIRGETPSVARAPAGCRFHPRCPYATDVCRTVDPPLEAAGEGRRVACHHPRAAGPQPVVIGPPWPAPAPGPEPDPHGPERKDGG